MTYRLSTMKRFTNSYGMGTSTNIFHVTLHICLHGTHYRLQEFKERNILLQNYEQDVRLNRLPFRYSVNVLSKTIKHQPNILKQYKVQIGWIWDSSRHHRMRLKSAGALSSDLPKSSWPISKMRLIAVLLYFSQGTVECYWIHVSIDLVDFDFGTSDIRSSSRVWLFAGKHTSRFGRDSLNLWIY